MAVNVLQYTIIVYIRSILYAAIYVVMYNSDSVFTNYITTTKLYKYVCSSQVPLQTNIVCKMFLAHESKCSFCVYIYIYIEFV